MAEKKQKKDKVLHTRIPVELEREIKERADALRIPVSNLVRNVLEDAFALVQHVGNNVDQIVGQVTRDASRLSASAVSHATRVAEGIQSATRLEPAKPVADDDAGADSNAEEKADESPDQKEDDARSLVFAWQPVTINILTLCADCDKELSPGESAHFGLTGVATRRVFICDGCAKTLNRR